MANIRKSIQILVLILLASMLGYVVFVDTFKAETEPLNSEMILCIDDCRKCIHACDSIKFNNTESGNDLSDTGIPSREEVWKEISDSDPEFISETDDVFKNASSDEFLEVSDFEEMSKINMKQESTSEPFFHTSNKPQLILILSLFLATALAGVFVSYSQLRNLRYLFLLTSLIVVGFVLGSCPCMFKSFDNTILLMWSGSFNWISVLWFLGLIPLTYLFGKVWCGWICHFGALQEFTYKTTKWNFLRTAKAQKILFMLQTIFFVVWIVWLIAAQSSFFCQYDVFRMIFNLNVGSILGWVWVSVFLVSLLFTYRPFCRIFCPIGWILGWITRIPFAQRLCIDVNCGGCGQCVTVCAQGCISEKTLTPRKIDSNSCILCGACVSECKKKAFNIENKKENK